MNYCIDIVNVRGLSDVKRRDATLERFLMKKDIAFVSNVELDSNRDHWEIV